MTYELDGRIALVTGASRGIGRAIAEAYARAGADVAVVARDAGMLEGVVGIIREEGGSASAFAADITDLDALPALVSTVAEAMGGLDVLVNNAGGNSFSSPVSDMRLSGWQKTQRLNVESVVVLCQAALPHLATRRGSIVNVASVAGLRGAPLMSHYGAAKAAVLSLTQSLAVEVASSGVRVNALVPGWIETDLTGFLRDDAATERSVLANVPMGRWGTPEEIAAPAVFLASEAAAFMTGQVLVVDGGLSARP